MKQAMVSSSLKRPAFLPLPQTHRLYRKQQNYLPVCLCIVAMALHGCVKIQQISVIFLFSIISRAASLSFNYPQFGENPDNLNLVVDVYHENTCLHLTRNQKDSVGRVIYKEPLHLWDNVSQKLADFTTEFSFTVESPNTSFDGDGITFYLARPGFPLPVPRDGSGIGLVSRAQMEDANYANVNPFVAVEFDTQHKNSWDPPYDHVGVDIRTVSSPITTEWYAIKDGRRYNASISYDSSSKNLSVSFTGYRDNTTRDTVNQSLYYVIDLKNVLPEYVEFGFSSATGLVYGMQTLCSWSFDSSLEIDGKDGNTKTKLAIGLSGAGALLIVLGLIWLVRRKMKARGNEEEHRNYRFAIDDDEFEKDRGPRAFTYDELIRATNNFAEDQKLGEGGFGGVYSGFLNDLNTYVAVKRVSEGSKQGVKEYASEVKIISQLRHRNLVKLIGWCHQKGYLLLVYELMPNGSLDSYLFGKKGPLTWELRYSIARGLASGLLYLHEEWELCVVHRDIKPSNVLLDSHFNAKLGDFGLARFVDHAKGAETTVLAGTMGYMAPEYSVTGKASKESDVYSFGVVALEIACGRKPSDPTSIEHVSLVEWVWELYEMGKLLEAVDWRLNGNFVEQEMERLLIVGLYCVHQDYNLRPTIRQAIQVLNFEAPLPRLPSNKPMPKGPLAFPSKASNSSQSSALLHKTNESSDLFSLSVTKRESFSL